MSNWSLDRAFEEATKNHRPTHPSSPIIRIYEEHETIPIEAWEAALIKTANFVEKWGVQYLPLFERVETELNNSRKQLHSLEKARRIATGSSSVIRTLSGQQGYLIEP